LVKPGDLSRALEVVFEQDGAPSLREIRERSGNPLALPVSSAARIVNRNTIPADEQQLQAFLTGCGVPPERHTPWLVAFSEISSQSTGVLGAASAAAGSWTDIERRVTLRHSRQWLTDLNNWHAASRGTPVFAAARAGSASRRSRSAGGAGSAREAVQGRLWGVRAGCGGPAAVQSPHGLPDRPQKSWKTEPRSSWVCSYPTRRPGARS